MTRQPTPGLHENFAEEAAMSTDKPLGYIREPGLRSLAEGNHTTMYPKQIPAHGYTIPVFAHPPAKREAGETAAPVSNVMGLIEAAKGVIASASDTYKKRNGHLGSFEDDSGEKCWIVPFDAFEALRAALATTEGSAE